MLTEEHTASVMKKEEIETSLASKQTRAVSDQTVPREMLDGFARLRCVEYLVEDFDGSSSSETTEDTDTAAGAAYASYFAAKCRAVGVEKLDEPPSFDDHHWVTMKIAFAERLEDLRFPFELPGKYTKAWSSVSPDGIITLCCR